MIGDILFTTGIFVLAAIGGLYSEKAGMLNIAIEGFLLFGAFTTIVLIILIGSPIAAVSLSVLVSILLGLIFSFAAIRLKANIFVAGLAINLFAAGLASFVSVLIFQTKGVLALPSAAVQMISRPWSIVIIACAVTPLTFFILGKTAFGLRLRVSGSDPDVLEAKGVSPDRYQLSALLVSSAMASLAGSALALDLGAFVPNMSGGRGWIALVAIYLGRKSPAGILVACLAFAAVETATYRLQGIIDIPRTVYLAFPYIITVIGLVVFAIIEKRKTS